MQNPSLFRTLNAALAQSDRTPDGELVRRYLASKDDLAFELLLRRHAELVWNVCRSLLRADLNAAEDAFQATFVALARQADKIDRPNCLGAWLFRVARHTSLRVRRRSLRGAGEPLPEAVVAPTRSPEDAASDAEEAILVAEEVDRLPERFRLPVVLCFFQGYSHPEAAHRLGWAVGTVASRIARAKERLRKRLLRRGVAFTGSLTAAVAAPGGLGARQPLIRTGLLHALGEQQPPNHILILSREAVSAMTRSKHTFVLASAVLALGVSLAGTWGLGSAKQPPIPSAAGPTTVESSPAPGTRIAAAPDEKPHDATAAYRAQSHRNLRRVAQAVLAYQQVHGHLPTDILDKTGKPLLSWRVAILPYMEQKALYKFFKIDEPWDSEANRPLLGSIVKLYAGGLDQVVDAEGRALTRVKRFTGPNTLHQPGKEIDLTKAPDGRANTLLLAEVGDPVPWTKPTDPVLEPAAPDQPFGPKAPPIWKGPYTNVVNVAFADGTALSLKPDLSGKTVLSLIYWNDGRVLPDRSELEARIPFNPDGEEIKKLLQILKTMTNQFVELSEEETRLLTELEKVEKRPQDPAAQFVERILELEAELNNTRWQVRTLREQLEKLKTEKKP